PTGWARLRTGPSRSSTSTGARVSASGCGRGRRGRRPTLARVSGRPGCSSPLVFVVLQQGELRSIAVAGLSESGPRRRREEGGVAQEPVRRRIPVDPVPRVLPLRRPDGRAECGGALGG